MNRIVRLLHREARLGTLEMVIPLVCFHADRRLTLLYFAIGLPFPKRCEFEADALLVGAVDQDLAVINLAWLEHLVGRERYVEENGLARRQVRIGRRNRHGYLGITGPLKRSRGEMKIAGPL